MAEVENVKIEPPTPYEGQEVKVIATVKGAEIPIFSHSVVSFTIVSPSGKVQNKRYFVTPLGSRKVDYEYEFKAEEEGDYQAEVQNEGYAVGVIPLGTPGVKSIKFTVSDKASGNVVYGVPDEYGIDAQYTGLLDEPGARGSGVLLTPTLSPASYETYPTTDDLKSTHNPTERGAAQPVKGVDFAWSNPDILTTKSALELSTTNVVRESSAERGVYAARSPSLSGTNLLSMQQQLSPSLPEWRQNNLEFGSATPLWSSDTDTPVKLPVNQRAVEQIEFNTNKEQTFNGPNPAHNVNRIVDLF
jgi:hypothetical protein